MAAVLRGAVAIEGDPGLLVLFQRLFPGPPKRRQARRAAETQDGVASERRGSSRSSTATRSSSATTRGDIEASLTDPTGLFSFDTRFLSKWVLTVDGQRLNALSTDDLQYFETRFFLVPGTGTVYIDAKLSVIRQRAVGDGFQEALTILNHDEKPVEVDGADRGRQRLRRPVRGQGRARRRRARYENRVERGRFVLGYERETFRRATADLEQPTPPKVDENGPDLPAEDPSRTASGRPSSTSSSRFPVYGRVRVARQGHAAARWTREPRQLARRRPAARVRLGPAEATYRRSLVDLAALRFAPPVTGGRSLPAAGLPWFMTMFGRDSIFTSLQALPFTPELAATTLLALGEWQGTQDRRLPRRGPGPDPARDALRRDDRVRGAAALALLRLRRRDAALRRAARRVRALDGRPQARARPRVRGAGGARLDRRVRRPAGQRLRLVPAPQRGDRPREPVLEGLVGLDLLPRRAAPRLPAGDVRAAGLRLRREDARRPPGPRRLERPRVRRPARAAGGRPQAPLQPRLLGRGRRVLRARARRRGQAGRRADLEQRPPALERHRRQVEGEGRRPRT